MSNNFMYNGSIYFSGTIIEIKSSYKNKFGYNSCLVFDRTEDSQCYKFHALGKCLEFYDIYDTDFDMYIETITLPITINPELNKPEMKESYIEGIGVAWMWYIMILFCAIFINGIILQILIIGLATYKFSSWRSKKRRENGLQ